MPRPSPQTDRLRWTMNLLSASPQQAFNLAQIARHLGVSKATCLPMVSALASSGWLVRHPVRKTYQLGPALIALGRAAERANDLSESALPQMVELSAETGLPCVSWLRSGDRLLLAEAVDPNGPTTSWNGLKRGHPLLPWPPLGSSLVTWADDDSRTAWLASAQPDDFETSREHYTPALDAAAERGFVVELHQPLHSDLYILTQQLEAETRAVPELMRTIATELSRQLATSEVLVTNIDPDTMYLPVSINAPVFGPTGEPELVVCITNVPEPISGTEVQRLGERVRDMCGAIST